MSRTIPRPIALVLACSMAVAAAGPDGSTDLRATQVTIAIERGGARRQFRATVVGRQDDILTVLTAAHCLSDSDRDGPAVLVLGGEELEGTVLSVARNPSYRDAPNREIPGSDHPIAWSGRTRAGPAAPPAGPSPGGRTNGEVPGPDSAVARFRFRAGNRPVDEAFRAIRVAPALTARSYPGPAGQTVSVRMVDQKGEEHALRAGNYSNPRWLEWGPSYKPIPGDSGGGVFVLHAGADGKPRPILIGIIVRRDDRGGSASLISLDQRWLADALPR